MDEAQKWRSIDMTLAVAAAAIVAYGVLVPGWSVFVVIALFWFENVVLGAPLLVALKLAFDILDARSVIEKAPSQPLRVRRFDISPEDDARRP